MSFSDWKLAQRQAEQASVSPTVFLSYAWHDRRAVLAVDQWLRDQGARVILDQRDFRPGREIEDLIVDAVARSGVVVVFWCEASRARPYPLLERRAAEEVARSRSDLRVIYFCLDETPLEVQSKDATCGKGV